MGRAAVEAVAQYGVAHGGQVHANLVRAASLWVECEVGETMADSLVLEGNWRYWRRRMVHRTLAATWTKRKLSLWRIRF